MGFLKGRLTFRRYRVLDPLPDDFRDRFEQAFTDHAFRREEHHLEGRGDGRLGSLRQPPGDRLLEPRQVALHALRDGGDADRQKVLPTPLVRAMVEKRIEEWCEENGRAKAPASVRTDIRLNIENDMLARTLPTVKVVNFCWNLPEGWVLFENTSDRVNDRFRTLVRNSFGIGLEPFSPLDFLVDSPELVDPLAAAGMTIMSGGGR